MCAVNSEARITLSLLCLSTNFIFDVHSVFVSCTSYNYQLILYSVPFIWHIHQFDDKSSWIGKPNSLICVVKYSIEVAHEGIAKNPKFIVSGWHLRECNNASPVGLLNDVLLSFKLKFIHNSVAPKFESDCWIIGNCTAVNRFEFCHAERIQYLLDVFGGSNYERSPTIDGCHESSWDSRIA
uniref:C-type lectin domain-containing protein n=1 Tax=Haemonchus placei TaxID=6290 RepID=A0A0N4X2F7_HAEPC